MSRDSRSSNSRRGVMEFVIGISTLEGPSGLPEEVLLLFFGELYAGFSGEPDGYRVCLGEGGLWEKPFILAELIGIGGVLAGRCSWLYKLEWRGLIARPFSCLLAVGVSRPFVGSIGFWPGSCRGTEGKSTSSGSICSSSSIVG